MCIQKVQPKIINTNNRNLNIKYNERLVKDIRKDEREKTLKEVENKLKNSSDNEFINWLIKELGEK